MINKMIWERLQTEFVSQSEQIDYESFLQIMKDNLDSAFINSYGLFQELSYERNRQIAHNYKTESLSKDSFIGDSIYNSWIKMSKSGYITRNEIRSATKIITLFNEFMDGKQLEQADLNVALLAIKDIYKRWDADAKTPKENVDIDELTKNASQFNRSRKTKPTMTMNRSVNVDQPTEFSQEKSQTIEEAIHNKKDINYSDSSNEHVNDEKQLKLEEDVLYFSEVDEEREKEVNLEVEHMDQPEDRLQPKKEREVRELPIEERFFNYLLELNQLQEKVVRQYTDYEKSWELADFRKIDEFIVESEHTDAETILTIKRPMITSDDKTPPRLPKSIAEWIDFDIKNMNDIPKVKRRFKLVDSSEWIYFADSDERQEDWKEYGKSWNKWAKNLRIKEQQNQYYENFFELVSQFEREGESLELVYGRGIFSLKHDDPKIGKIESPLLTIKLDLELEPVKSIIYVKIADDQFRVNTEMLSGVTFNNYKKVELIYRELEMLDIFEDASHEFTAFIQTIHSQGRFIKRESNRIEPSEIPSIHDDAVIMLRRKNTRVLRDDLSTIIHHLEEGTLELNDAVKSILHVDHDPTYRESEASNEYNLLHERKDLFFPLPANEQQVQIVERLRNRYGVTVQGPPGTGKTHTIANLVSHYLSQGKKVLITSQKENALKVLRDKIPASIRDLCVPVLGGGRESLSEIEGSINIINEKLGELDIERLKRNVNNNLTKLDESYREEAKLKSRLKQYAEKEGEELYYNDEKLLRYEVAERVANTTIDYSWILDDVNLEDSFPLTKEEFKELWDYRQSLSYEDLKLANTDLPNTAEIPSASSFNTFANIGNQLNSQILDMSELSDKYQLSNDLSKLVEIQNQLDAIKENFDEVPTEWKEKLIEELTSNEQRKQYWLEWIEELELEKDKLFEAENKLITHDISLNYSDSITVLNDIIEIGERLKANKSVDSGFYQFRNKKLHYLIKEPVLNNRPIRTFEDAKILYEYVTFQNKKAKAVTTYNRNIQRLLNDELDGESLQLIRELERRIERLRTIQNLYNAYEKLSHLIEVNLDILLKQSVLDNVLEEINSLHLYFEHADWKETYTENLEKLEALNSNGTHEIIGRIYEAYKNLDVDEWKNLLNELSKLYEKQETLVRYQSLVNKLKDKLPLTAKKMVEVLGENEAYPNDFEKAFKLKGLVTWLNETKELNQDAIRERIYNEQDKQHELKEAIVHDATWSSQLNSITGVQKRALSSWKSYIKRVGKGTGKYARQHLLEARKQMKEAQGAIPVWIMPVTQVMENFPVDNEKFDVVIFDESSQCDVNSINVLLRGKQTIVVGDDKQISPDSIGTKQEDINTLTRRYLSDLSNASLYDGNISLYEIAEQTFPKEGKLMLREHFRCVPEIIQFSNDLSYDGQMIPLRTPFQDEIIDPAVLAVYVEEGYNDELDHNINRPEAERIAKDIQNVVNDDYYEGQSIGVIALQGNKQAKVIEAKVRELIGDYEFTKREIICGSPYDFQGDERDIMFLSLVIAPNRNFNAQTRENIAQRYNVAASRARNQLRLYHSVTINELRPNDLRHRLLSYCLDPKRKQRKLEEVEHLFESPFEKEVYEMIVSKGYRVTPQVEVGHYRIDMVIEGLRNRLAVEVDGEKWHGPEKFEEDMMRQSVLERAGWSFWRVRGNEFYLDRVQAMKSLWEKLDEMGIEPAEQELNIV